MAAQMRHVLAKQPACCCRWCARILPPGGPRRRRV